MNDVHFTSFLAEIAEFFDPALVLLRIADSDVPNVSKMVPGSANVKARMQEIIFALSQRPDELCGKAAMWQACYEHYVRREGDLLQDVHFVGYICDPEFADHKQLTMPRCMTAFNEFCEKIFPGDAVRQTNAVMGLSAFKHGDGLYGREATILAASRMPGYRWAQMFSCAHEDFQRVQAIVLALFTSQSPTERNHKAEAMCKTKARNRLKSVTTDKVLYVCCNSRLESKTKAILLLRALQPVAGGPRRRQRRRHHEAKEGCAGKLYVSAIACIACMCKCSVWISSSSVR